MRLHLLCCLLIAGMQQSLQEDVCLSIKIRSQYYHLSTLRQFPNRQPEWIRLQNGLAYYTLNKKTFNIAQRQQDDTIVSNISAPYAASIEDEHGNKVFQRGYNAYVYISKLDREYLLVTDGQENNFKFVLDPIENIVFTLSSSNNQPYGKMFWFSLRRYESENNTIEAKQVTELDGSLTSIDLNPNTGNILVSGKKNSIGTIYFMKQQRNNPCQKENTTIEPIRNELLINLFRQTALAYKEVALKNGTIVCDENEEYSELDQHNTSRPNERGGAPGREISPENKMRVCRKERNFQRSLSSNLLKINKILIDETLENERLTRKLEENNVAIADLANKLHRLTQTALFNKQVTSSHFNTQRSPAEVPEYETDQYVCILREELAYKHNKLDMSQQLKVLKESLQSMEKDLRPTE